MNNNPFYHFFILCVFALYSCHTPGPNTGNFVILPSPQHFEIQGVSSIEADEMLMYYKQNDLMELSVTGELLSMLSPTDDINKAHIILNLNEEVKPEGYQLEITQDQILIGAMDKAGFLYALMTLEQLIEDARDQGVRLPICEVMDYPLLTYRAIHLDVKHHLERKQYYYQLMDRLAKYKINGVIVELEDKIKYESQPLIGSADAWSVDEWNKLSEYAKERNIEISPLVQGLGHASFILKHEEYKHLRDDPQSDWAFNPLDPETYEVQFDLYREAIDATPYGRYLHIGGDEVHTTGRGSDKSALELQLIWLNKVCKYAEEQGRIPIFWDDMPLKFAEVYRPMFDTEITKNKVDSIWSANESRLLEFIDQFPKNCIYMRWNYRSPDTYGNLKAMDWFKSNGFKVMGATAGQTRWVLMPQNESNIANIRSFALSSIENGLDGLLLTLWDDDSPHFELYMRGILSFAEYSWSGDQRSIQEIKTAFLQRYFGPDVSEEMAFIDLLEGPVEKWKDMLVIEGATRNDLIKQKGAGIINLPDPNQKGEWSKQYADLLAIARSNLETCDTIAKRIKESKSSTLRNRYTLQVYEQVNELVRFTSQMVLTLEAYDQPSELIDEQKAKEALSALNGQFSKVRSRLEEVYGQTRILTKPDDYILDQDHHRHSANQTRTFDWQFIAELELLEKLNNELR